MDASTFLLKGNEEIVTSIQTPPKDEREVEGMPKVYDATSVVVGVFQFSFFAVNMLLLFSKTPKSRMNRI